MKKLSFRRFVWVAFFVAFTWSCQKENITKSPGLTKSQLDAQARVASQDNSQMVATVHSVMSMTADAFGQKALTGGRTLPGGRITDGGHPEKDGEHPDDDEDDGDVDDDEGCEPNITRTIALDTTHVDSLIYSGTIIIDFSQDSTCQDSTHVRSGKITDVFKTIISFHDSIQFSSVETITFEGFHKDSIQVDGTIIIRSSSGVPTTVEIQNVKITYPDGTFATWNGTLTFDYQMGEGRHCEGNTIKVTGSLSGTTRAGLDFTATITKEIVFKKGCFGKHKFTPVSGTVEVVTGGVTSTLDYGDGTCDKKSTIEVDGETTEHEEG